MKTPGKSTSYRVIQLGVLSAGKVKPRQLRSFRNDWMFFSRFWTKLFLGTHPHNFLTGTPDTAKKKEQFCTVNLQNKANILNNICSFCLTNSRGVNLWHSTISARKWVQVQSHAVRVSKLTNETTASSKCILQKSNMAMENYPFGCFPRSPSFSDFLAGHDYRSVATGHQAPPFSRATIFTAVSHPWRVRSMKRGYSNAKKTTVPTWGNQDGSWVYSQFGK